LFGTALTLSVALVVCVAALLVTGRTLPSSIPLGVGALGVIALPLVPLALGPWLCIGTGIVKPRPVAKSFQGTVLVIVIESMV